MLFFGQVRRSRSLLSDLCPRRLAVGRTMKYYLSSHILVRVLPPCQQDWSHVTSPPCAETRPHPRCWRQRRQQYCCSRWTQDDLKQEVYWENFVGGGGGVIGELLTEGDGHLVQEGLQAPGPRPFPLLSGATEHRLPAYPHTACSPRASREARRGWAGSTISVWQFSCWCRCRCVRRWPARWG